MRPFIVQQLDYDLTPVAWLALVGHHLNRLAPVFKRIDTALPVAGGVANSDVLRSYLGLLVQGKSDFDAIENFRGDAFVKQALGIKLLPSGRLPGLVWVLPGLGAARPGVQHSAFETEFNFERVIPMAQRLSAAGPKAPILARLDSGFDSAHLMRELETYNQPGLVKVDWLIKWNPRTTNVAALAERVDADSATRWAHPRLGKRVTLWDEALRIEGIERPLRRVLRLIERTIDKHGQLLIEPELTLEGWTTSLSTKQFDAKAIIALYADHGTHEQFHSEFKTDLDLERLPSGKFDTNYLVCELAALAMNILRLMGQDALHGPDAPVRHPAKRRRLKTVMQELIYRAGRLIEHGRRIVLGLGANDRAAKVFIRSHAQFAPTP